MSDNNTLMSPSLFIYIPSTGAAAFFTVAFAISLCTHVWQTQRTKNWSTTGLLCFCGLLFVAGFASRIFCSVNYTHRIMFLASQFIIYATPPILELANFHVLGRILYYVPYLSPIHPGRVLTTFLFFSCLVEILNALGVVQSLVGTLFKSSKTPEQAAAYIAQGHALMKASLILQLVFALAFITLAATFQRRCLKKGIRNRRVMIPVMTLYVSMAFITARTIFRTVEHFAFEGLDLGQDQPPPAVMRYEWYFYVFEASMMLLALAVFNVFHPGRFLPHAKQTYLAQDGLTEIEGPGWNDDRPFMVTLCDPFNIMGCLSTVKGSKGEFWNDNGYHFPVDGNATARTAIESKPNV